MALTLREATPTEKIACWRTSGALWAKSISIDEFVEQEQIAGNGLLAQNNGIRYWVLADGDTIVSAVQTLRKPVILKTAEGVTIEDAYGVAGVFTPEQHRKKGLATQMLSKLGGWLDGEARLSILFTSIPTLYAKVGWRRYPAFEAVLKPAKVESKTTPLTVETLPAICERDIAAIKADFEAPLPSGKHTRVAFLPTFAQAMWHYGAEDFQASKLSQPRPTTKGAVSTSGNAFGYWHRIYAYRNLMFLRIAAVAGSDEEKAGELAEVLKAAQHEAAECGFEQVTIWNPDALVKRALEVLGGQMKERGGSLPCIRLKGDSGDGKGDDGIEWVMQDKYIWC